jgi:Mg-chelatase subunit ChlD
MPFLSDYSLGFEEPRWLALLFLLPMFWWMSFFAWRVSGSRAPWPALAFRSLVVTAIVLALAEVQIARTSNRVNVFYLVDRSLSVAPDELDAATRFVNASMDTRNRARGDRAGIIAFAREATIETALADDPTPLARRAETTLDPEHTNLAEALKLAQASFPPEGAKRVVVLTDGNQNFGDALEQARSLADSSIGIDVVPLQHANKSDVRIDKVTLFGEPRRSSPFEVRIVLQNDSPSGSQTLGRITLERRSTDASQTVSDETVLLAPGKRVLSVRQQLDNPDFYTYEARFVPDDARQDARSENNRAATFAYIRGQSHVLVIADPARLSEFTQLVEQLRGNGLQVTVASPAGLPGSPTELQRFDAVILADLARAAGDAADGVNLITDQQIEHLVDNTQRMGAGLIVLGGPNSFGAGGWTGSLLEKAMPLEFQPKGQKVLPVGAVVLVIDRSGSMTGQKLDMSKAAALAAAEQLGPHDFLGVVAFNDEGEWVVPLVRASDRATIAKGISRLDAGGGTYLEPAMQMAFAALVSCEASLKHIILLTDGETKGDNYAEFAQSIRKAGVTITSVAIGADPARQLLEDIADAGGGRFYVANTPSALPRIFTNETRRVARPVIYENPSGFRPSVALPHEMLRGVSDLPAITGLVRTRAKHSPLVEVSLVSPKPEARTPLLVSWTYGLGKAVALTTDAGARWARSWVAWPEYGRLFNQIVRWALRPAADEERYIVSTLTENGKTRVVATAIDENPADAARLELVGSAVGPGGTGQPAVLKKTAPGRYEGELETERSGNYFIALAPGADHPLVRVGISVPYSEEFKERGTNEPLLRTLAAMAPKSGEAGAVVDLERVPAIDGERASFFRGGLAHGASQRDAWPLALFLACCIFLADVFARRVQWERLPGLAALGRMLGRMNAHQTTEATGPLTVLRSRKQELADAFNRRQAAASLTKADSEGQRRPQPTLEIPNLSSDDGYTERLLKAKQQAHAPRRQRD